MALEDAFNRAAERIKEETSVAQADQLELYGLFKQAKMGDCGVDRPGGLLNMKEKAKWDAWNGKKGTEKDSAMKSYIAKVDSLAGTNIAGSI